MKALEEIRSFLHDQTLFSSDKYLHSDFEVVTDASLAEELQSSQLVESPYQVYNDFFEMQCSKLYVEPSEAADYYIYQHASELIDIWRYIWDYRSYGDFIDQILWDLSSIIKSEAKHGEVTGFWKDVLDIYRDGAMPCGVTESGSLLIHSPAVSEIQLSPVGEKRRAYDLKKKTKRLEEIDPLIN
ncbi:hypothetical protein ACFPK9_15980 [Rubritalea spongiae]|uniref:Uncharacterized protein n=1 Tax=Rubritalea spongiae TaxID=430797 RepID=A0ABW5E1J9_9BACT